jgi:Cu-processing system ATP-binding protein
MEPRVIPLRLAERDPAIRISGLSKRYGRLAVLDRVNLEVEPGRVTAVVGPNSAGKTTLIKAVLGLVRPDAGRMYVFGEAVGRHPEYRRRIGYMPQNATFPDNLTARELLDFLRDLRQEEADPDLALVKELAVESELDKPLRTLSGGSRQKVSALLAFLFRPDLLILAEPTAGLDPVAGAALKDRIRSERTAGRTFVVTSHVMSELEELADDVAFLLEGTVRFQGPIEELRSSTGEERLERAVGRLMKEGESGRRGVI